MIRAEQGKIRPMKTRNLINQHSTRSSTPAFVSLIALLLAVSTACAQSTLRSSFSSAGGTAASGLAHYDIKASALPAPKIENEVNNGPRVVPRPESASLTIPTRFPTL